VEEALLAGPLEEANQWSAIAKIAELKLCAAYRRQYGCDFISAQPTNLYGPADTYDLQASHVVPALIAKIHRAKERGGPVEIWGTGAPRREFLHVDDLADALVFLMERYSDELHINVGCGADIGIRELAEIIAEVVGYYGEFRELLFCPRPGNPHCHTRRLSASQTRRRLRIKRFVQPRLARSLRTTNGLLTHAPESASVFRCFFMGKPFARTNCRSRRESAPNIPGVQR
jgi:GDP-L-fucose synthase